MFVSPILSLAFSIHENPGVYALLLGSGVSRSAGIPTGWEIVLDLVRKLAHLQGEDCKPDPSAWFSNKFGEQPDYAKLLEAIAKSPAERSQLLRSYFEPTHEEREQGLKLPTKAHQAIAELVVGKHLRLIVTTNFDRLLEKALEAQGITPLVISTPDSVDGALPITHSACTVIKVHGDYLDTRIRNTPKELERYDKRFNRLLDRLFDEFGLIVCGWSAEWDTALRAAIERCRSRRFTIFWTVKDKPGESAQRLINLKTAQVLPIQDADSFFSKLAESVQSLEDISKPHPISAKVAVATMKRYVVDARHRIQLNDLVMNETEKLFSELSDREFSAVNAISEPQKLGSLLTRYEALAETLLSLVVTGCYWGEKVHEGLWTRCLERIANAVGGRGPLVRPNLRRYPALLLLYAGGIGAIACERYNTFATLLTKPVVRESSENEPLVLAVNTAAVADWDAWRLLPELERHRTPVSDHLFSVLREPLCEYLPDDTQYQRQFDRFEYFLALVYLDLRMKLGRHPWAPTGCFGWRGMHGGYKTIMAEIEEESAASGDSWLLLQNGLFDGSAARFREVKTAFDSFLQEVQNRWW